MKADFQKCRLGSVINLKRGYDLPKQNRVKGPVPIISSSGITDYHNEAKVSGPGVVTGRYGTLGEIFYVEEDYWPLNTSLYVQDFKGNDPKFISYFLRTLHFGGQNAAGAVPGVNRNHLHELQVCLPDIPTQKKIAGILSAYDDLIENNLRRIKILEEMAQSLYREWFVHFRFPGYEKTKFVDSPLRKIPEGWAVKSCPEAVAIRPKVPVPKHDCIPFVPMGSLSGDSMLIGERESRTKASGARFQNGDTLFARITPCLENGKTGFVQFLPDDETVCCGSTELIVLRSKTLCPEYVYLMARSEPFRDNAIKSMSGATGRQRVREECFEQFFIAQPPKELLQRYQEIVQPKFRLIQSLALRNQNLRKTRDLLLPKLLK